MTTSTHGASVCLCVTVSCLSAARKSANVIKVIRLAADHGPQGPGGPTRAREKRLQVEAIERRSLSQKVRKGFS